jgi:hypothetical protein
MEKLQLQSVAGALFSMADRLAYPTLPTPRSPSRSNSLAHYLSFGAGLTKDVGPRGQVVGFVPTPAIGFPWTPPQYGRRQVMHANAGVVAVVEDDAAMRKSLVRLLRASGYATASFDKCGRVSSGRRQDAFARWSWIFHLPGCRGSNCGITCWRRGPSPGHIHDGVRRQAAACGALASGCIYLHKPFDTHQLIEALDRCS